MDRWQPYLLTFLPRRPDWLHENVCKIPGEPKPHLQPAACIALVNAQWILTLEEIEPCLFFELYGKCFLSPDRLPLNGMNLGWIYGSPHQLVLENNVAINSFSEDLKRMQLRNAYPWKQAKLLDRPCRQPNFLLGNFLFHIAVAILGSPFPLKPS